MFHIMKLAGSMVSCGGCLSVPFDALGAPQAILAPVGYCSLFSFIINKVIILPYKNRMFSVGGEEKEVIY